jgi:hypothetical protein
MHWTIFKTRKSWLSINLRKINLMKLKKSRELKNPRKPKENFCSNMGNVIKYLLIRKGKDKR